MDFLSWHYSFGVNYFFVRFQNLLLSNLHQFSFKLLLLSMFSPWKRMISHEDSLGFNPGLALKNFSYNTISRAIGAIVRFSTLLIGVVIMCVLFIGGLSALFIWLLFPFLSYPLYSIYKKQPRFVMADMLMNADNGKIKKTQILHSSPMLFLASHLGVTQSEFENLFPDEITLQSEEPQTFAEFIRNIIDSGEYRTDEGRKIGITEEDLKLGAHWWDERRSHKTDLFPEVRYSRSNFALSLLFGYTPELDRFSEDMGRITSFTKNLIGREETVERMERIFASGKSIVLHGPVGVGKKTVVYEFARRAVGGTLGRNLSYSRVMFLDFNSVLAQSHDVSQKKRKLNDILEEATYAGNVILVIKDMHEIIDQGVEGLDFSDLFSERMERGLRIISILDQSDYERSFMKNDRLNRYFEPVLVNEMTSEDALKVLMAAAREYEKKSGFVVTVPALRSIMVGSEKYLTQTPFPEKTLEILDQVIIQSGVTGHSEYITPLDVQRSLSEKTGIALTELTKSDKDKLTNLEDLIHEKLVNQSRAVSGIARSLRTKTIGVVNSSRPVGSFLFLGPTGVGKTETAKVLSNVYYGSEKSMIRFDMSEYASHEGLERLIGSATRGSQGELTTALKNNPACLLLIDEIEKAPKEVLNIFLSLLDEGRVTDAFGKSVIAQNVFVIATSNAGSEYIRTLVTSKANPDELQKKVVDHVLENKFFSPEFINRFDGVVVYEPLTKEHMKEVAKKMLSHVVGSLKTKNIELSVSEKVYEKVAADGYDPALGARPMRRLVELQIGDLLAKVMLSGEVVQGDYIELIVNESGEFDWIKRK